MDRSTCRACGGQHLQAFYEVRNIPVLSATLLASRAQALCFPTGDLELAFCHDCGFIQNGRFDSARTAYTVDYEDMQGFSPRWRRFAEGLVDEQIRKFDLRGRTALEIGCGKGEFLTLMVERGAGRGVGFDPAYRPERTAGPAADRLDFRAELYTPPNVAVPADYVCCRHTLEHELRPGDLLRLIREGIGRRDVPVFLEVPDVERILEEQAFWDIYYEHCSYFSRGSLARLCRRAGFRILDVYRAYDDQYLMIELRPGEGEAPLPAEADQGRIACLVERFAAEVGAKLDAMRDEAAGWRAAGRRVVTWGSGSKGVGYLTTLGLRDEGLAVVDSNPHRWGRFIAGTGHRIVGPRELPALQPDLVLVMNPIYREEVRRELNAHGLDPEVKAL